MRLKGAQQLPPRLDTMVENAYYHCIPPSRPASKARQEPPLHRYVRHLVYVQLSKASAKSVLRQLRMLPWDRMEDFVVKCLLRYLHHHQLS